MKKWEWRPLVCFILSFATVYFFITTALCETGSNAYPDFKRDEIARNYTVETEYPSPWVSKTRTAMPNARYRSKTVDDLLKELDNSIGLLEESEESIEQKKEGKEIFGNEEFWECPACGNENYNSQYCEECRHMQPISRQQRTVYIPKEGDIVFFGHDSYSYEYWTTTDSKLALWTVIKTEGRKALLLSVRCYDNQPADNTLWGISPLRTWMNSEFLNALFTEKEQEAIIRRETHDGNYITEDNIEIKEDISIDKLFELSYYEARKYLRNPEERRVNLNSIALKPNQTDPLTDGDGHYGWWLRSVGKNGENFVADPMGRLSPYNSHWDWGVAVRPAMWVDFEVLGNSADDIWYMIMPIQK